MKIFLSLSAACLLLLSACNTKKQITEPGSGSTSASNQEIPVQDDFAGDFERPKNIVLLIGDGMGLTQITAAMYSNGNKLELEKFPVVGLHKSYASDNLVTDSAAGATAFSCGVKTYNGAIGVDPDTAAVTTILEEAEANSMATGLVATSTITHATPASFIAHQASRQMHERIAADFLETEIDLFIGGGKKYFTNREIDDRNLYKELKEKNYTVADYFSKDLERMNLPETGNFAYLTANENPLTVAAGRDYLPMASEKAVNFLADRGAENGFFLMIEGSQIDWGGHANESDYIITELLDFDKTIKKVLDFAAADGETLVIVTADHETGGYAINPGSTQDSLVTAFTTKKHTAVMIPVFAYGPGAELFAGIYENIAIHEKMRRAFGWTEENEDGGK